MDLRWVVVGSLAGSLVPLFVQLVKSASDITVALINAGVLRGRRRLARK